MNCILKVHIIILGSMNNQKLVFKLVGVRQDDAGVTVWADASLWVDGLRIYQVRRLPVCIDCG